MLYSPAPLHIPDGFLTLAVSLICWLLTIAVLTVAVRRTEAIDERQTPLMGIMAAFIFAAQMINFPVAGGTSGHLLGGALAAIVLGPWAGMLVMTAVVGVQGLLFQDGGLLVMGANILNMGLLTAAIGYGFYRATDGRSQTLRLTVAGIAAWLSVMAGALATALELWLSGTARLDIVVPAMLGVHALIGIGEALITVAALAFIFKTRPDILGQAEGQERGGRGWIFAGFAIALVVVVLSPLASVNPDGLMRVATDLNFINSGQEAPYQLLSGYSLPFLEGTSFSTILAGIIGIAVVAGLFFAAGRAARKEQS
ncbi:MAG: energy-coupling factor ABC transporter permease [Anaerolineales bacterium]|nr:energy-coupling factor ABC transporter permease [Anaerolineales bacterium]